MLVDLLIKCDWSVKDVQGAVNRVKSVALLDWMQADFKEIATVPATAKRIENAIAEISASLEKLSTVTLFKNDKRDYTEIRDGIEYYVCRPIAYEFNQRENFVSELQKTDDYFDIKNIRAALQNVLTHCRNEAIEEVKYSRVLTDAELAAQIKRNAELCRSCMGWL